MEKKLTYIVIDDDHLAHNVLQTLIGKYNFMECLGCCFDGFSGINMLIDKKPDLLFLDIEMPGMTGMELLDIIDPLIIVILTTSFPNYAVEAYLHNNVHGFIKKPVSPDDLWKTLKNVLSKFFLKERIEVSKPVQINYCSFLFVKGKKKEEKLYINDILSFKVKGNYIDILRDDNTIFKYKASLKKMTEILHPNDFVRINKTMIVAVRKIKCSNGHNIELLDKSIHFVGSEYIANFEAVYSLSLKSLKNKPALVSI